MQIRRHITHGVILPRLGPGKSEPRQLTQSGVAVEKLHFSQNSENFGDRKCLGRPRKSFVGLPNAKFFRPVLRERVFQHPQAITLIDQTRTQKKIAGA
jgi:hypothetical protein